MELIVNFINNLISSIIIRRLDKWKLSSIFRFIVISIIFIITLIVMWMMSFHHHIWQWLISSYLMSGWFIAFSLLIICFAIFIIYQQLKHHYSIRSYTKDEFDIPHIEGIYPIYTNDKQPLKIRWRWGLELKGFSWIKSRKRQWEHKDIKNITPYCISCDIEVTLNNMVSEGEKNVVYCTSCKKPIVKYTARGSAFRKDEIILEAKKQVIRNLHQKIQVHK